jgi:hypothetical protein
MPKIRNVGFATGRTMKSSAAAQDQDQERASRPDAARA